ncbi:MAG: NADH-quinone oxidoreductase subunit L [Phycisphaerae bacterium]|nr:NADH-quinone oxidoreductase subunit L [Phycisphaerae bacterium]
MLSGILNSLAALMPAAEAGGDLLHPPKGAMLMLAVPVLTLVGVLACTICAVARVRTKLPAWISVACLAGAFGCVLATFLGYEGPRHAVGFEWIHLQWGGETPRGGGQVPIRALHANFGLYVDTLTLLWMLFVTGLATLIALYASEYMAGDVRTAGYSRFFVAFNLFVFSMSCLVMADNLLLLYLGWEGVGLCSYLLIGYFYKKPSAVAAAKKAFIVNRIGDLGLALGIMLIFVKFGTVEYATLLADSKFQGFLAAATAGDFASIPWDIQLIPALLMIGAFGKSAQFPLYVWLPDAMEGPTPVSALIHAATMVTAGVFLIARTFWVFQVSEYALPIVAWIGAITALLAATIGMAQFDIKRIMAYSTVSQLGYMFAGLGVMTSVGAAFHVFTHAFFKALLFLACGAVMHGFAGQLDLRKLSGVQKMPGWRIVGVTMLVGCLNLAGFPLLAGFWSKDMILAQAFAEPGYSAVGWVLLLTAGLTAYYTFRVYFRVFVGPQHFEPGDEVHGHDDAHGHGDHGHAHAEPAHDGHGHGDHAGHAHGSGGGQHGFHPHPPGWAINLVLVVLAIGAFAIIPLNFIGEHAGHGGWAADMVHHSTAGPLPAGAGHAAEGHGGGHAEHGTFLGMDPHKVMYYVSGVVGIVGIGIAFVLHLAGRTEAARSRADGLLPALGPIPGWAQHKWYVDEFYDFLIRTPLWVAAHLFHLVDKLIVDGLVNLFGFIPRALGKAIRPSQSGVLHGYALAMAGGVAFLLLIVLMAAL